MNVITGAALGRQAWVGDGNGSALARPEPHLFLPVEASPSPSSKPRAAGRKAGGLWTSTFDERHGSDWVQWCLSEEFRCDRETASWQTWLLDPDPAARVVEIDCYADLQALVDAYPHAQHYPDRGSGAWSEVRPAWHEIAEHFDAVHLTERGQWDTRLSHPLDLYGWDCESTLWLRWAFAAVEDGGVRAFKPPLDAWWLDGADTPADQVAEARP